ncbi:endonuclease/exonuclease/phosphatase family protein [Pontibacter sp. G13]|uniref:endonuclease/exonuclease/phosphatase family protein n=1 Tax=Pontibacter sp. G13 TaxID=3074898 RepID=UPI00288BA4EE|nr:endonuclease/exonuclease/phosphatase family protein [Pontibacter sp. G13]WNJ19895.1 endonuclease/exonuclease/phosphatase family protein [Pontibacter sp. G13]
MKRTVYLSLLFLGVLIYLLNERGLLTQLPQDPVGTLEQLLEPPANTETPATPETPSTPRSTPAPTTKLGPDEFSVITWNIQDLGSSKTDLEIAYMAEVVREADIVAIQEVVAGNGGAQAVAKLADELNRMGAQWDYRISDPTTDDNRHMVERYAYLWKPSRFSVQGRPKLAVKFEREISREPYLGIFVDKAGRKVTLASFHAIPTSKDPETEVVHLKEFPSSYRTGELLMMGDFNLAHDHEVFDHLEDRGYEPAVVEGKTSLRMKPKADGDYFSKQYDNLFYQPKDFRLKSMQIIDIVPDFDNLKAARGISDHLPVQVVLKWR